MYSRDDVWSAEATTAEHLAQILALAVRHLSGLPLKATVLARLALATAPATATHPTLALVAFTASRGHAGALASKGVPVWTPRECVDLARAVEGHTVTSAEFARLCALKRDAMGYRVTPQDLGVSVDAGDDEALRPTWDAESGWADYGCTWGRLLRELGLDFVEVRTEAAKKQEKAA